MLFKQRLDISMHLGRKSGAIDKKTALGMGQQTVGPLRRKNVAHPCIVGDHCQNGIAALGHARRGRRRFAAEFVP